jgi:hypothetical protein
VANLFAAFVCVQAIENSCELSMLPCRLKIAVLASTQEEDGKLQKNRVKNFKGRGHGESQH